MNSISLKQFYEMLNGGNSSLNVEYKYINDLNIFPVPDGDTGINMKMTSNGGYCSLADVEIKDLKELSLVYSKNLLFNARGNSGVIFSQIMKGFCSNFKENQLELNPQDFIQAFLSAKEFSYKAVQNPIEGTILTVVRKIAELIKDKQYDSITTLFDDVLNIANEALASTKDTIPELKNANVVDSGAYGLVSFLSGMNAVLKNNLDEYINDLKKKHSVVQLNTNFLLTDEHSDGSFGYCTEIILKINGSIHLNSKESKKKFNKDKFDAELKKIGDSIVSIEDNNFLKIHIHTFKPYLLLQLAQKYGEFEKIKIENMTNQYLERLHNSGKLDNELKEDIYLIFTCDTNEMANMIYEYHDNCLGIPTEVNAPSIKDFILYIKQSKSKNILLVVDNSNFVMAAKEAIKYFEGKINISLINTNAFINTRQLVNDIAQNGNLHDIEKLINKTLPKYHYSMITVAAKDDKENNVTMGDKFVLINKKIAFSNKNYYDCLVYSIKTLLENNNEACVCTLIYGTNANQKTIQKFTEYVESNFGIIVETYQGNQSIYTYYLGLY